MRLTIVDSKLSEFIHEAQQQKRVKQLKPNRIIADWHCVLHDSCVIALHLSRTVKQTTPNSEDLCVQGIFAHLHRQKLVKVNLNWIAFELIILPLLH